MVSLSGPVGIGKTISAARALDAVTSSRTTARIGRMQLGREEILELLLIEFDLAEKVQTTPQRFGAFRGLLNDKEDASERVFIVVEDACRVGVEGLQELESLTSADSGDRQRCQHHPAWPTGFRLDELFLVTGVLIAIFV